MAEEALFLLQPNEEDCELYADGGGGGEGAIKSGSIFRVGIFLDFAWLATRTVQPHGAYEIELTAMGVELNGSRRAEAGARTKMKEGLADTPSRTNVKGWLKFLGRGGEDVDALDGEACRYSHSHPFDLPCYAGRYFITTRARFERK